MHPTPSFTDVISGAIPTEYQLPSWKGNQGDDFEKLFKIQKTTLGDDGGPPPPSILNLKYFFPISSHLSHLPCVF